MKLTNLKQILCLGSHKWSYSSFANYATTRTCHNCALTQVPEDDPEFWKMTLKQIEADKIRGKRERKLKREEAKERRFKEYRESKEFLETIKKDAIEEYKKSLQDNSLESHMEALDEQYERIQATLDPTLNPHPDEGPPIPLPVLTLKQLRIKLSWLMLTANKETQNWAYIRICLIERLEREAKGPRNIPELPDPMKPNEEPNEAPLPVAP